MSLLRVCGYEAAGRASSALTAAALQAKEIFGWLGERRQKLSVQTRIQAWESARRREAVRQTDILGRQERRAARNGGARRCHSLAVMVRQAVSGVAVTRMCRDRRQLHSIGSHRRARQPGREHQEENAKERQQARPTAKPAGSALPLSAPCLHRSDCHRALPEGELVLIAAASDLFDRPRQVVAILLQIAPCREAPMRPRRIVAAPAPGQLLWTAEPARSGVGCS